MNTVVFGHKLFLDKLHIMSSQGGLPRFQGHAPSSQQHVQQPQPQQAVIAPIEKERIFQLILELTTVDARENALLLLRFDDLIITFCSYQFIFF